MSINTLLDYSKIRKERNRTIIAPANPRDIRYSDGKYFINYVVCVDGRIKAISLPFSTYAKAYAQMNEARVLQGFQPLSALKEYKG